MKQYLPVKKANPSGIALESFFSKFLLKDYPLPLFTFLLIGIFFINVANAATRTSNPLGGPWASASTWGGWIVPSSTDTVVIATTGTNAVTVSANTTCSKLVINSGATLTLTTFGLTVNGPWINNGTFNAGTSAITFGGPNAAINGTGTGNFNIIAPALGGVTLNINASTTCTALTFGASTAVATVNISSGVILTVTGAVIIPNPTSVTNTLTVAGVLNTGSIAFTSSDVVARHLLTISTGTVNVSGSITQDASGASPSITFTGAGKLNVTGALLAGGFAVNGTLTTIAGSTVNYNGTSQTVYPSTYLGNLTLSGSSVKTLTGVTVNGILSMEGTATASVAPTYGPAATLQYNTSTPTTPGIEWITPFVATGGIVIANTGIITLGSSKVLSASVPLTFSGGMLDIAGYNLTVTAAITGASSTSYLRTSGAGNLVCNIANAGSFTCPVGNTAYDPVTITNNAGSADNFNVRVFTEVLTNGTSGTPISNPHVTRTWDINKAAANAGSGVNFVFNWNPGETSASITTPTLYHYNATYWEKPLIGTNSPGTNSLTYTGYQGTFSPFAVVDFAIVLPISWLSFTAQKQANDVLLKWSTASELNSKNFLVEHSTNGVNWQTMGTVNAANNSVSTQLYQYVDANPSQGINYYRLQQTDLNGNSSYSKIVNIIYSDFKSQMIIYPNPVANGVMNIQLDQATHIKIFNSAGVLVMSKQLQSGTQQIDVSNLAKGIYQAQAGTQTLKIVIQ